MDYNLEIGWHKVDLSRLLLPLADEPAQPGLDPRHDSNTELLLPLGRCLQLLLCDGPQLGGQLSVQCSLVRLVQLAVHQVCA